MATPRKRSKAPQIDLQATLKRIQAEQDGKAAEPALDEVSELPGWQPLGRHIIGGNIGALTSATLFVAISGAFLPVPGWEDWANPVVRTLIVFVLFATLLWGWLWLAYPPVSVDLGTKLLRWRGIEIPFDQIVGFDVRTDPPYVRGRLTTRSGQRITILLHGQPTAGIGSTGRALLARVIQESPIVPRAVDEEGLTQEQVAVLNKVSSKRRWNSLDEHDARFELTGPHSSSNAGPPLISSKAVGKVPGVTALRVTGFVLVVTTPAVFFFTSLFALLPPYFMRGLSAGLAVGSALGFAVGVWCFSLARERLERVVLKRSGL